MMMFTTMMMKKNVTPPQVFGIYMREFLRNTLPAQPQNLPRYLQTSLSKRVPHTHIPSI